MTAALDTRSAARRSAARRSAAGRWLRRNLFRSPFDAAVTIVFAGLSGYVLFRLVRFALVTGRWEIVRVNLKLLMVGRYPVEHLLRVSVAVAVAALLVGLTSGVVHRRQVVAGISPHIGESGHARVAGLVERSWPVLVGVGLLLALSRSTGPWMTALATLSAFVVGRVVGALVPKVLHPLVVVAAVLVPLVLVLYLADGAEWDSWGGMMLNVFIAVAAMILCFPLGVFAALGRRSSLPVVSAVSTGYIELFRGAPLFVLLLMANVALRFFVPDSLAPSDVVRAIVVFTLFTGAYMAEIVRGGLQSVPSGQEEAGRALGLSPFTVTFRIVLPQALRNVIPAQVGQLISLFKDTTLAGAALGLFELLQVADAVTQQGPFAGQRLLPETFAFVALLFWLGSYTMSRESQRIEEKLGVGLR